MRGRGIGRRLTLAALVALMASGCERERPNPAPLNAFGNPQRGVAMINAYGCGACHMIPGVDGAGGMVGPPLTSWAQRTYIAGMLPNTPAFLMRWIMTPQQVVPGNAMPDMGVSQQDARDIAAYLYTIR